MVPAVGVHKVAVFHAQTLRLYIHLIHKHLLCAFAVKGTVPRDGTACFYCRHLRRIIAAGHHHTGDQLLHGELITFLQLCHRGIRVYQGQRIPHNHSLLGVQILQNHIGGQQFGDAGRIQLLLLVAFFTQVFLPTDIIGKVTGCRHLGRFCLIGGRCCSRNGFRRRLRCLCILRDRLRCSFHQHRLLYKQQPFGRKGHAHCC